MRHAIFEFMICSFRFFFAAAFTALMSPAFHARRHTPTIIDVSCRLMQSEAARRYEFRHVIVAGVIRVPMSFRPPIIYAITTISLRRRLRLSAYADTLCAAILMPWCCLRRFRHFLPGCRYFSAASHTDGIPFLQMFSLPVFSLFRHAVIFFVRDIVLLRCLPLCCAATASLFAIICRYSVACFFLDNMLLLPPATTFIAAAAHTPRSSRCRCLPDTPRPSAVLPFTPLLMSRHDAVYARAYRLRFSLLRFSPLMRVTMLIMMPLAVYADAISAPSYFHADAALI